MPTVIDKVCGDLPPNGVSYLVTVDGQMAGIGGLRSLSAGVAEVKRIYCRPQFRGMKLGEQTLQRLLGDATAFGYHSVYLETAPFMSAAHHLYEENGFTDCAAYEGVEVPPEFHPRWRFMRRSL